VEGRGQSGGCTPNHKTASEKSFPSYFECGCPLYSYERYPSASALCLRPAAQCEDERGTMESGRFALNFSVRLAENALPHCALPNWRHGCYCIGLGATSVSGERERRERGVGIEAGRARVLQRDNGVRARQTVTVDKAAGKEAHKEVDAPKRRGKQDGERENGEHSTGERHLQRPWPARATCSPSWMPPACLVPQDDCDEMLVIRPDLSAM